MSGHRPWAEVRDDRRARGAASETDMPPRPPQCRPAAQDMWQFGASRMAPRGMEGDPCGPGGPVLKISSDEERAAT